jgi:hypothetical protein
MIGAISKCQREVAMPHAAHAAPDMRPRGCDDGLAFAITYRWDGGELTGLALTANRSPRRLGRLST